MWDEHRDSDDDGDYDHKEDEKSLNYCMFSPDERGTGRKERFESRPETILTGLVLP